ncbi:hypothetical protein HV782_014320 [Pseudomonas monsensis]|uniref:hypothetical protein n=1 Tax=Pseudomonas monsensis TaxID=2745509 RepID=UPI0016475EAB|nr:hypothetical protein [Pseudomonas monsensis]QXH97767.1 hypothetical protein HV782_014320 [Pseudomonas monsensis]
MMKPFNGQVTAAGLRIDGVSESDPTGRIPLEQLINGTTVRIPRWDRFPVAPVPGEPITFSILRLYWTQKGNKDLIFEKTYTYLDDQPEFTIPLTPEQMSIDGTASIHYVLEGYDGNYDDSPIKNLTIDHTISPSLEAPFFPDADFWGYISCIPFYPDSPPIWEEIRLIIYAESIFEENDKLVLQWQGFSTLNGKPPELTPLHEFSKTLTKVEAENGFIFDLPFDPYVKPMFNNHSGIARYTIFRNNVPIARSYNGLVKIDRTVSGEEEPCGGW